jgi:hypothetical protein
MQIMACANQPHADPEGPVVQRLRPLEIGTLTAVSRRPHLERGAWCYTVTTVVGGHPTDTALRCQGARSRRPEEPALVPRVRESEQLANWT